MRGLFLLATLLSFGCSSAPRIDSVELTRSNLRIGEESFLTLQIADDEAELDPATARMTLLPVFDEDPLETEVVLPGSSEVAAQVIIGLSFSGAVNLGPRSLDLVVIDSGGAESEAWPLSLTLTP
jgi:hypothetical protein